MKDKEAIENVLKVYFESMLESSATKVHEAFHEDAKITGYIEDELHAMSTNEFAEFVNSQEPWSKNDSRRPLTEIISIDITGATAIAKVRDDYLGLRFLDSMTLLKQDGIWRIYNKLFHVEGPAD